MAFFGLKERLLDSLELLMFRLCLPYPQALCDPNIYPSFWTERNKASFDLTGWVNARTGETGVGNGGDGDCLAELTRFAQASHNPPSYEPMVGSDVANLVCM